MKEDILEQVVDDYLQHCGYFTIHNVRFKPDKNHPDYNRNQDSVASDVDVVGFNPLKKGPARVWVVSCKSWQPGFDATAQLNAINAPPKLGKKERWRRFRELFNSKWATAFRAKIEAITGQSQFRYSIAVTSVRGNVDDWVNDRRLRANLDGNPFSFLTLEEMWNGVLEGVTTTPAASEIGRLAQLLKAAKLTNGRPAVDRVANPEAEDPRSALEL